MRTIAKAARRYKPLVLGRDAESGERMSLEPKWFETHLHLVGPPDAGKTRLLLWIFQYLTRVPQATIVLINPKGALARMARDWAVGNGLSKRLVWFDPGDPEHVVGYNPLRANGLPVATQAKAVREAIRSAWGQSSFDQTPQLARLLYLALAVSLALGRTLLDALRLLRSGPAGSEVRGHLLSALASGAARGERDLLAFLAEALAWFDSLAERRQEELAASALARLESFVCDPVVGRILTQTSCLDLGELIANHKILLVNLEIGRPLRMDDVKLLGRFVVNDIVNHVFSRPPSPHEPVYLILDEVQNFATRDLCSILDMGRELGLHCILAHQNLGQLHAEDETGYLYASVRGCARTKFYFGGLPVEDLDVLIKDACIEQFDSYKVKDELTTLELDPVESQREVETRGWNLGASAGGARGKSSARSRVNSVGSSLSEGESSMDGESSGTSFSSGHVSGSQFGLAGGETILPSGEIIHTSNETDGASEADIASNTDTYSETHAHGTHQSRGVHASRAEGEVEATQETNNFNVNGGVSGSSSRTPFYEYKKHWRVSSRTFESEQEFLTKNLQKVKGQPKAHAFVKVPGKPGRLVVLPRVRTPWVSASTREAGLQRVFSQPFYSRPDKAEMPESTARHLVAPETLLIEGETGASRAPAALPARDAEQITGEREKRLLIPAAPSAPDPARDDEDFAGPEVPLAPQKIKKKRQ